MISVTGRIGELGTDGTSPGVDGAAGTGGGSALAIANPSNTSPLALNARATALGGNGGKGGDGANGSYVAGRYVGPGDGAMGSTGGLAEAIATGSTTVGVIATATGGVGGDSGTPGAAPSGKPSASGSSGGAGGEAFSVTSDITRLPGAFANSIAAGGAGGVGYGPGNSGGAGGAVNDARFLSTATVGDSAAGAAATASLIQTGGAGGAGVMGANGGAGAASSAVNAVFGYSNHGLLTLSQTAVGGAGGRSDKGAGGIGGSALSTLIFDDTRNAHQSASINASATAEGGAGGRGDTSGVGGDATAALSVIGKGEVVGNATARGGEGAQTAGAAVATITTTGVGGSYSAHASTSLRPGSLILSDQAATTGTVGGTASAKAAAGIGGTLWTTSNIGQAVALFEAAPTSAAIDAAIKGSPNLKAAFGTATAFFGDGEVGGAYANGGAASQTVTSSFSETVDLSKLASSQDLVIGLYGATSVGAGIRAGAFHVFANGVAVINQTFATTAAAVAYFTDHAVDVGSLAGGSKTLDIRVVMSTTTTSAGSGFFGNVLLGDAPKATSGAVGSFASAMAAMSSGPAAAGPTALASSPPATASLSLPSHAA